jgi:uncharacterized protein (DUF1810 family)
VRQRRAWTEASVAAAFVAHDVMTDRLHNASKPINVPFKRQPVMVMGLRYLIESL